MIILYIYNSKSLHFSPDQSPFRKCFSKEQRLKVVLRHFILTLPRKRGFFNTTLSRIQEKTQTILPTFHPLSTIWLYTLVN